MDLITPIVLTFWLVVLFILPPLPFAMIMFRRESIVARIMIANALGLLTVSSTGFIMREYFTYSLVGILGVHMAVCAVMTAIALALQFGPIKPKVFTEVKVFERTILFDKVLTFPTAVLILAVALAIYTRLEFPLTHFSLNANDPYVHLQGLIAVEQGIDNSVLSEEYHHGFHMILLTVYKVSGVEMYDMFRYTGGILGVFSVLSVYGLVASTSRREVGAMSALMFASFPLFARWFAWQTLTMPEVMALTVFPIAILLAVRLVRHIREDIPSVALYAACLVFIILAMITLHWLTLAATIYACVFILVISPLILQKHLLTPKSAFIGGTILAIGIACFILYRTYDGNMHDYDGFDDFLMDMLKPKRFDITLPNAFGMIMVLIAGVSGFIRKRGSHMLLAGSTLFIGVLHITGWLYPSGIQYRVGSFFTVLVAVCLGIMVYEFMTKEGLYLLLATAVRKVKEVPFKYIAYLHYSVALGGALGYGVWVITGNILFFAGTTLVVTTIIFLVSKWVFSKRSPLFGEDLWQEELELDLYLEDLKQKKDPPKKKKQTLPKSPWLRPPDTNFKITDFRILVTLLFVLIAIFPPPIVADDYYQYGYDGVAEAALMIKDDHTGSNITVYHQTVMINVVRDRTRAILYPDGKITPLTQLIRHNASTFIPGHDDRPDCFIFIEKEPFPIIEDFIANEGYEEDIYDVRTQAQEDAVVWMDTFLSLHHAEVYFEDDDIIVYHYVRGD